MDITPLQLADAELTVPELRRQLEVFHQQQKAAFKTHGSVSELVNQRSDYMDGVLTRLWQKFGLDNESKLALVAVGGYGRGELHPKSDIDLLIVSDKQFGDFACQSIGEFVTLLWDLKLEVGHSVRTLADCIEQGKGDITIATNLIEARLLFGNEDTFDKLQQSLSPEHFWPSDEFFTAKRAEQSDRHRQYRDNGYNLEPDIKGNPGGLRDMQTISWIARRHFGAASLLEMTTHQYLTQEEYRELLDCQNFLWTIRFALHMVTGRADNRLLFDYQAEVASSLGFTGHGNEGVEQMMKRFYQTIRRVAELNEMLLQHFDEAILGNVAKTEVALDEHFQLKGSLIYLKTTGLFFHQPESIMQLFLHIAQNQRITGIYSSTLREIREARRRLTYWLQDFPECRELFVKLLKHPRGMGLAITLMHKYGVLAAYIPQWSKILGQMQFDLFHAYTVDEHTHRLIKYIYHYPTPESKREHPICSELCQQINKPELLYLAAIFHDIAKGRKGDHSELGAVDAREFCLLHGFSPHESRLVAWLVEKHLVMSVVAQRRDIQDPEVISEFAKVVRDEEHLNYLLLLTVADICATNDTVWNSWKSSLLKELYFQTQKALRRGLENPLDIRDKIREHKTKALEKLQAKAFNHDKVKSLWRRFKADYFLRYIPAQIAWHSEYILQHGDQSSPLVLISKHASRGGSEVFVYSRDSVDLFANVVTELDSKNLNIHDAQVMTSKDGFSLDTFVVLEQNGDPISPDRIQSLKTALVSVLSATKKVARRRKRLSRQKRQFNVPTQVTFLPERRGKTFIELVAFDSPGLLAKIGLVFQSAQLEIRAAKITTIGERVEDFFIVLNVDGTVLTPQQQTKLKKSLVKKLTQSGRNG